MQRHNGLCAAGRAPNENSAFAPNTLTGPIDAQVQNCQLDLEASQGVMQRDPAVKPVILLVSFQLLASPFC